MTDEERMPVLGRPPVDGSDEELEAWADAFLDAILGPESDDLTSGQ
jgi:hypothetical protein